MGRVNYSCDMKISNFRQLFFHSKTGFKRSASQSHHANMIFFSKRCINCNYKRIIKCFLHRFNTVIKICSMNRLVKVAKQIDTRRNEISKLMTYYRTKTVTSSGRFQCTELQFPGRTRCRRATPRHWSVRLRTSHRRPFPAAACRTASRAPDSQARWAR